MRYDGYLPEHGRDLLAHAIVASLQSWPEMQRRIFIEAHYSGKTMQDIADQFRLQLAEVIHTLEQCELKLYRALRDYSHGASPQTSGVPSERHTYSSSCCFR